MQLDNEGFVHQGLMNFTNDMFAHCFKDSMDFVKCDFANESMGWFILEYFYKPRDYKVVFENHKSCFTIHLYDSDDWMTAFPFQIKGKRSDTSLEKSNIQNVIESLKSAIDRNDIPFHKSINEKLYLKRNGTVKRIKDPYSDWYYID